MALAVILCEALLGTRGRFELVGFARVYAPQRAEHGRAAEPAVFRQVHAQVPRGGALVVAEFAHPLRPPAVALVALAPSPRG